LLTKQNKITTEKNITPLLVQFIRYAYYYIDYYIIQRILHIIIWNGTKYYILYLHAITL